MQRPAYPQHDCRAPLRKGANDFPPGTGEGENNGYGGNCCRMATGAEVETRVLASRPLRGKFTLRLTHARNGLFWPRPR